MLSIREVIHFAAFRFLILIPSTICLKIICETREGLIYSEISIGLQTYCYNSLSLSALTDHCSLIMFTVFFFASTVSKSIKLQHIYHKVRPSLTQADKPQLKANGRLR